MPDRHQPELRIEPLDKAKHDRAAFCCEHELLNIYIREQANQDVRKRVAAVYILTPDGKKIAGYYTLSQYAINTGELPEELSRKLHIPRYDKVPATLLGRLARDKEFKGARLGELLLMGALHRALEHSRNVASFAVLVDAKDEKAKHFYQSYGFLELPGHPRRLILPMKTIDRLFASK